jgi:hypothetical protein
MTLSPSSATRRGGGGAAAFPAGRFDSQTGDPKRRPTHPGAVLREDVLPALGMT